MLPKRIISSIILIAVLLGTIFLFPKPVVAVVIALLIGMGLWEFYVITEIKGFKPLKGYGIGMGIVLSEAVYYQIDSNMILAFILMMMFIKHAFKKDGSSVISDSAVTMLGILYISFLFTFIIKLRFIPNGQWLVFSLFVITKVSDISAYVFGTKWGKHKLIPRISAKKSIEGAISGITGSVLASLFLLKDLGWQKAVMLGIFLSVAGQIGDLVESLMKRDAQIKDSSKIVPGMGGVLDVMDSLLFAGPVMYLFLQVYKA